MPECACLQGMTSPAAAALHLLFLQFSVHAVSYTEHPCTEPGPDGSFRCARIEKKIRQHFEEVVSQIWAFALCFRGTPGAGGQQAAAGGY